MLGPSVLGSTQVRSASVGGLARFTASANSCAASRSMSSSRFLDVPKKPMRAILSPDRRRSRA